MRFSARCAPPLPVGEQSDTRTVRALARAVAAWTLGSTGSIKTFQEKIGVGVPVKLFCWECCGRRMHDNPGHFLHTNQTVTLGMMRSRKEGTTLAQRNITRAQAEVVAGRVSALNECFY